MSVGKYPEKRLSPNDLDHDYGSETLQEPQEPRVLAEVFVTRRIATITAGGSENVRVAAFRAIAQEEVDGEFFFTDEYGHTTTVVVSTQRHGSNT